MRWWSLKAVLTAALSGLLAASAGAATPPATLLPGVTYERQVTLTPHGPVALDVIVGPRPGGLLTLEPALANDVIPGAELLASIEHRLSATATAAGVAGDFATSDGRPLGLVLRAGALQHQPLATRVSLGVDAGGGLRAANVELLGTWQGSGQRRLLSLVNGVPTGNQVALFTSAWGPATPAANGTVEFVLQPFPPATSPGELAGTVAAVAYGGGSTIPPDGAVLVARGSSAANLLAEAKAGQQVKLRLVLKPDWTGVIDGIGGGPLLVSNGVAVFRPTDAFPAADLLARTARSAAGQRADGSVVLVTVEGGRPGSSVGMTNFELAQALVRLGAVVAVGLATGPQAAMAFDGTLLSRSSPRVAPAADALLFVYRGVYVPPVAPVVSPDGDGVTDTIALSYKTVRPSTVTAELIGPQNAPLVLDQGERAAQTYSFTWSGLTAGGASELEGTYRWTVTATDDLGRQSAMERTFTLNRTLGTVRPAGVLHTAVAAPQPVASYNLARTARVAVTVLSSRGVTVARLPVDSLAPGAQTVSWDGRDVNAAAVAAGAYTVSITAANDVGSVTRTVPLTVRR